MRRAVALLAALSLLAVPGIARADEALEEYLERASAADYRGRGVLFSSWGGMSAGVAYEVVRSAGVSMVRGPDGDLLIGTGTAASRSGTEWRALEIPSASSWWVSDRYVLSGPQAAVRLGRPAIAYTVLEGDLARVRLVVDERSAVPLLTEVLDGDGRVYRLAVLIDFESGESMDRVAAADPVSELSGMAGMETMAAAPPPPSLPEQVAGYRRADAYRVSDDTVQVFYTDGLFSFSVFEAPRGATPEAFRAAATWEVAGERYRRIVTPAHAWIQWHSPNRSYVLVGDLPPDHLAAVLTGLPEPGDRSWIVRLWRRLFG